MSVRTHVELSLQVGFDGDLSDKIFDRDVSELLDTLDHAVAQVVTLSASETDRAIDFGDITQPRLLYIEANRELQVKFFGADGVALDVVRQIDPASSSASELKAYFLATCQFASLHITNPSATSTVAVKILIAGDLTA